MLKYFKKELFAKERCASLVNEKPYNTNKCNENTFLLGHKKLCFVYCQGGHFPANCDKVNNVNVRKKILKNSLCCYLYLKTGDFRKYFTKNYICRICNKKNHISICEEIQRFI